MVPRSKSDSEEETIVSIEIVAANLRKEVDVLDKFIQQWRQEKEGGDGGESGST